MTITVCTIAAERVEHVRSTSTKLSVTGQNAGVDYVSANVRAGPVESVTGIQRPGPLVNAIKTPRRIALRCVSSDHVVFLERKSTRQNSSHSQISYAAFCLKKNKVPSIT